MKTTKSTSRIPLLCAALVTATASHGLLANPAADETAQKLTSEEVVAAKIKHSEGAKDLSLEQDDLSADVQDLIDEQTHPEVVKLLKEIEITMAEATDLLEQTNTDGATIAVETEVIEKIFEAAKKKQQKSGGG